MSVVGAAAVVFVEVGPAQAIVGAVADSTHGGAAAAVVVVAVAVAPESLPDVRRLTVSGSYSRIVA